MKTLLIDNYDSFTYNLFQLLAEANGEAPVVVRNDAATWAELSGEGFESVVISPGPGRPEEQRDFGICADAIRESRVPLLGVCLGHQGVGHAAGAEVRHAPEVRHGRLSAIYHDRSPLFADIPQGFQVVRYHSLCLGRPLPEDLQGIAWTRDGVVMGVAHRRRPIWGVQFHPESICTDWGRRLLVNFRDLAAAVGRTRRRTALPRGAARGNGHARGAPRRPRLRLHVRRIDRPHDPEQVFVDLYADQPHAFWLDSSKLTQSARFSFMGAAGGPLSAVVTYDVAARRVRVQRGAAVEVTEESIFDYLSRELKRLRCVSDDLPFDFNCGFVGYLGYELKADCGGERAYRSELPDATFVLADRLLAFDHYEQCTYLVCLADPAGEAEAERWIAATAARLGSLPALAPAQRTAPARGEPVAFRLSRSRERYLEDIRSVKRSLVDGESYEVCLTNQARADVVTEPLPLYRTLRRVNPAPFSAYLRLGGASVLSSSPERFLRIGRDGWVEAKPMKGTIRRDPDPVEDRRLADSLRGDEKTRSENLMITDLLRNDLGVVCGIGTIHVPQLMEIESYETVHQMVSTIRGRLRDDVEPPQAIRACFPGGSMTGAPKKRTMEIIDALEQAPRGVYSGAIGYFGLGGGGDFNVVIRTIVMDGKTTSIGMGGAIVMLSDDEDEYQETLLKARPLLAALAEHAAPDEVRLDEGVAPALP